MKTVSDFSPSGTDFSFFGRERDIFYRKRQKNTRILIFCDFTAQNFPKQLDNS